MDAIVDKSSAQVDEDIKEQHKKFHQWFESNNKKFSSIMPNKETLDEFKISVKEISTWKNTADDLFKSIYRDYYLSIIVAPYK